MEYASDGNRRGLSCFLFPAMLTPRLFATKVILFLAFFWAGNCFAQGTVPVSVVDNGATVVLSNGTVAVTVQKASAAITTFNYNGANILAGGYQGGRFYWSWNQSNYQNPSNCVYTLTADPATNGGTYAEVKLHMTWSGSAAEAAMDVDIYYSLRPGTSGVYAAAKLSHPAAYPFKPGGELRMAAYTGATFNWLSVDAQRNLLMPSGADETASVAVPGAPKEVMRLTTGTSINHYECKYDYSAAFGDLDAWGWSSTTSRIGVWMTVPSREYYPGGPMKRELTGHATPVLLNMLGGTHYGTGAEGDVAAGETWQKMYGPFLIYCNRVSAATANAPLALWQEAIAQAQTEQAQWPYSWFAEPAYVPAAGRGTVTGRLVVQDGAAPAAPADGAWVGVAIPPVGTADVTDFQRWSKNYQFWVKTDAAGNFTIPNVMPGTYALFAFGGGATGQFTRAGAATVAAGTTAALGTLTWTPARVAPTVWAIGVPDRSSQEFRHGNDYWVGGTYPNPSWAKFMDYPTEFPQDVRYVVGQSNWATDWNYVQPYNLVTTSQTAAPEWKVNFTLRNAPTAGTTASVYVAAAASYAAALFVKVNGTNITTPTTGIFFADPADATIRKGNYGAFAELRFGFPASLLRAGANEISFTQRRAGGDIQYDYLRLEAAGTSTVLATAAAAGVVPNGAAFAVFPSPAAAAVAVQFQAGARGLATCVILNAVGAEVRRLQVEALAGPNLLNADVAGLPSGLYTLRLTCGAVVHTAKFTK